MRTGHFAAEVREYLLKNYIEPARAAKAASVQIRAGDIHKALNFHARLPLVCSALTAVSFRRAYNLRLLKVDGPGQSTTTTFTFGL
jgi:hypothetical protein